ncbi:MAG: hypothetical protein V9G18_05595 [Albidovulum sp.]|jgi:hypothetical protein|uniref:hypothetical protein n=1 Tax=Albidovulum sp. TaxID=1872424 RepID=UPI0030727EE3
MRLIKSFVAIAAVGLLAGCLENDAERGVVGAAGGAVVADAIGGNALTGAVVGGAAGVFCDDAGICQ